MLTSFMPEWHDECVRWIDAVIKAAAAESPENKALMSEWAKVWSDRVQAALAPVAEIALADQGQDALQATREALNARATKAGLTL
jgi:phenol hydroxylase P1 protein